MCAAGGLNLTSRRFRCLVECAESFEEFMNPYKKQEEVTGKDVFQLVAMFLGMFLILHFCGSGR